MKTEVTFRSNKFPPYDGEEKLINPGLWGKRLAEYLVAGLNERGIVTEDAIPEDWGWFIPVQNEGFRLAICCGHQGGQDDEFLCFLDPSTPTIRKWFRKIDTTQQVDHLASVLDSILSSDPDIQEVCWSEQVE